jgi:hypothetical protein
MHGNKRCIATERNIPERLRYMGLTPETANLRYIPPPEVGRKRPEPDPVAGVGASTEWRPPMKLASEFDVGTHGEGGHRAVSEVTCSRLLIPAKARGASMSWAV